MRAKLPTVIALASGGGHWEQLIALREAFAGCNVHYVTTLAGLDELAGVRAHLVPDCNRNEKWKAVRCVAALIWLIFRLRPDAIVTTGALPGFFACVIGRHFRARTMWIDSVANGEEMSMAGRLSRRYVDRCLTQWPAVAAKEGVEYVGSVL